jgi:VWFA-related protein
MSLKRIFVRACWISLAAASPVLAQTIPADELRVSSQAYRLPAPPNLKVQANLVEVRVVVRDASGKPVGGLQQSDFQVFDNGKLQTISSFSVESPVPASASATAAAPAAPVATAVSALAVAKAPHRYVALFFDDLNMSLGDLVPVRKAAQEFVRNNLEAGDRVGIFTSSATLTLEFTDDTRKILDSLAQLRTRLRKPSGGAACPRISPYQAHMIANMNDAQAIELGIETAIAQRCMGRNPRDPLFMPADVRAGVVKNQAMFLAGIVDQFSRDSLSVLKDVVQYLGKMPGRRIVVLASSGFLALSMPLQRVQDNIVDIALRAGVVINSLDARGLVADSMGYDEGPPIVLTARPDLQGLAERFTAEQRAVMSDALAYLAYGTGGRFFHNNNDLARGVRELAATPDVSYVLGFVPENLKPDRSYHTLKVTLTGAEKYKLDARRGYVAPDKLKPSPVTVPDKFDVAVLGSDTLADFRTGMATRSEKFGDGESMLRVQLHVDTRDLPFLRRDDRSHESLRFVLALFDAQGKFLAGTEGEMILALKDDTLARLSEQGLEQGLSVRVAPGAYRVRLVMQESMHGRMAAQSRSIEVQ